MTYSFKKLTYSIFVVGFLAQGYYGIKFDGEDNEDDISGRPSCGTNNNVFDLIKIYEENARNTFDNVKVIPGTNLFNTALHFEEGIKMNLEGDTFPGGIPREFFFECTFRTKHSPIEPWNLFYLAKEENKSVMQLAIDPNSTTIDFFLPKSDGEMEIVSFEGPKIFDDSWHKIKLRLTNDSVGMWVDCERVLDLEGREEVRLAREQIDASDGSLMLAVGVSSGNNISIDIEQMTMSCNAKKPKKTACEELPKFISKPTEEDKTANETCPKQCPAGPLGPPGHDELPGLPGLKGLPGFDGYMGIPGAKGEKGFADKGEQGQKGEQGEVGLPGYTGLSGVKGEPGNPGMHGEKGDYGANGLPGINGIPGRPGLRGLPSTVADKSEIQNLVIGYVRDYIKEHKSELMGPPGRDGFIGLPGNKGDIGYLGMPGLDGYPGMIGEPGPRGPAGEPGVCPFCDF